MKIIVCYRGWIEYLTCSQMGSYRRCHYDRSKNKLVIKGPFGTVACFMFIVSRKHPSLLLHMFSFYFLVFEPTADEDHRQQLGWTGHQWRSRHYANGSQLDRSSEVTRPNISDIQRDRQPILIQCHQLLWNFLKILCVVSLLTQSH